MIDAAWAALGLGLAACSFTSPLRAPVCTCAAPPCCVQLSLAEAGGGYAGATSRSMWLANQTLVAFGCSSVGLQLAAVPAGVDEDGIGLPRADAYAAPCNASGSFPLPGEVAGSWAAVDTRLAGAGEYRLHMSGLLSGNVTLCVADGEIQLSPASREVSARDASLRSSLRVVVKNPPAYGHVAEAVASLASPAYSLTASASGNFSIVTSATATHDLLRSAVVTSQSAAAVLRRPSSAREAGVFLPDGAARPDSLPGLEDTNWTAPTPALMVSLAQRADASAAAALAAATATTAELQALGLLLYFEADATVVQSAAEAARRRDWVLAAVVLSVVALTMTLVLVAALYLRRRSAPPPRAEPKPAEGHLGAWAHARLD